ncbi:MAG: alpha-hydroxy-acid oxidizing protein, partial [Pseudomonadota bacterium]|nr:alpha-hydroxy-acid oxidizing protein [Pseudomonadota bacterium]
MQLSNCLNVADLPEAARRRILRGVFDYPDKGTEDQEAFRGNRDAFDRRISPKAILLPSKRPEIH